MQIRPTFQPRNSTDGFQIDEFKELLLDSQEDHYTEDSEDESAFKVAGKRGFGTNIDDFLKAFGTFVGDPRVQQNRLQKSKTVSKALLLAEGD